MLKEKKIDKAKKEQKRYTSYKRQRRIRELEKLEDKGLLLDDEIIILNRLRRGQDDRVGDKID